MKIKTLDFHRKYKIVIIARREVTYLLILNYVFINILF